MPRGDFIGGGTRVSSTTPVSSPSAAPRTGGPGLGATTPGSTVGPGGFQNAGVTSTTTPVFGGYTTAPRSYSPLTPRDFGAAQGTTPTATTPNSLGLQGVPGATATINGQQFAWNNGNWQPSVTGGGSVTAPVGGTTTSAPNIFGADSPWQTRTGGFTGPTGTPAGRMNLAPVPTQAAAQQIAQLLGANLVQQNMTGFGPAGAPSAPDFGLDFGAGDIQDIRGIITALQRGDSMEDILARIRAGINTPMGQGVRDQSLTPFWSPTSTNPLGSGTSVLAGGRTPITANSPFNTTPSSHLGFTSPATPSRLGTLTSSRIGDLLTSLATSPPPRTATSGTAADDSAAQKTWQVERLPSGYTHWVYK